VLAWAAWLSVLDGVLWAWTDDPLPRSIFAAAAAGTWLLGIFLFVRHRQVFHRRALPDLSLSVLAVAAGVVFIVNSLLLGRWLTCVGAGFVLLGLGGVAREVRAARRLR
jgi:hypothetical protein